ncbi:hypothetical protein D3C81_1504790 [compost metagenome]
MRKLLLNELETTDCFAKLDALIGVARRIFKGAHCCTVVGQGDEETFVVKLFFHAVKAITFPTEHVFFIQFDVIKGNFTATVHAQAEFLQLIDFDTGFRHVNKPLGVNRFIRRCTITSHHHDIRGIGATGDKALTAIKINLTIFACISGFQTANIRSSSRFCDSGVPHLLTGALERHDFINLFLGAFTQESVKTSRQLIQHVSRCAKAT